MTRQDKATSERHTKTLRELVKKPENKICADCKHNDPRWASWNLGVFLCIRCSGIHRSMGTHISKVKSVDLDVWTPEQMESILKWGNYRANLYWEAHLKPGHVPPDHKMESFIRSKYESRRWAMDGPPPSDPSVLEQGISAPISAPSASSPTSTSSAPTHTKSQSISARQISPVQPTTATSRQTHQLLSASYVNRPGAISTTIQSPQATQAPVAPPQQAPENDLFSLDFHALPPSATPGNVESAAAPKKDAKQDILSLFSTPSSAVSPSHSTLGGQFQAAAQPIQSTSMMGQNGTGIWGVNSGWTGAPAVVPSAQGSDIWGSSVSSMTSPQSANLFANTSDVWASAPTTSTSATADLFSTPFATSTSSSQKKDDVFGDLWGGFK